MTYHKDLSGASWGKGKVNLSVRNCGWLTKFRPFVKGENKSSPSLLKALADNSKSMMTRGHHVCELCNWEDPNYGNGEIWLRIKDSCWRMPRMVFHYTSDHSYRLPAELDASIFSKSFKLLEFDGHPNKDIPLEIVDAPQLRITAKWKESRFKDLIEFSRNNDSKWSIGYSFCRDGYYVAEISIHKIYDLEYIFEDDPHSFPDHFEIAKE